MSDEHKRKISTANKMSHKGLKQSIEHITKRTAKLFGNRWNVGRNQTPESIAKRALANTGKKKKTRNV